MKWRNVIVFDDGFNQLRKRIIHVYVLSVQLQRKNIGQSFQFCHDYRLIWLCSHVWIKEARFIQWHDRSINDMEFSGYRLPMFTQIMFMEPACDIWVCLGSSICICWFIILFVFCSVSNFPSIPMQLNASDRTLDCGHVWFFFFFHKSVLLHCVCSRGRHYFFVNKIILLFSYAFWIIFVTLVSRNTEDLVLRRACTACSSHVWHYWMTLVSSI